MPLVVAFFFYYSLLLASGLFASPCAAAAAVVPCRNQSLSIDKGVLLAAAGHRALWVATVIDRVHMRRCRGA